MKRIFQEVPPLPYGILERTIRLSQITSQPQESVIARPKTWTQAWMDMAFLVAENSRDPSSKVGAVVVNRNQEQVSSGYNDFPRGVQNLASRYANRELKYAFIQHAERNALDFAKSDIAGSTLYVTTHPCAECTKSIIQKGISCVVCPEPERGFAERWEESIKFSKLMLSEAGVSLVVLKEV